MCKYTYRLNSQKYNCRVKEYMHRIVGKVYVFKILLFPKLQEYSLEDEDSHVNLFSLWTVFIF